MSVEKYISPFIQSHFPDFYKEYGPNFIAFVKAYYEWMETAGNPIAYSRRMYEYADIDTTADNFIKYFKNKYMLSLPESVLADKRLLSKHVLDLYKSKGSLRAYELLFRLLFNEDIQVYIPGNDIFKLSDNRFIRPQYIEVSDSQYHGDLIGRTIVESSGLVTAVVENYFIKSVNNKLVNVLVLTSVGGSFRYGQKILCDDLYVDSSGNTIGSYEYNTLTDAQKEDYSLALDIDTAPIIIGSLSSIGIENGGYGFAVGDLLNVDGEGEGGVARVASVRDENGKVKFTLLDGGSGYSLNAAVQVVGGGGTGATFKIGGLIDKEVFHINTDVIDDLYLTQLDGTADGCNIAITGVSGTFYATNTVYSSTTVVTRPVEVTVLLNNGFVKGEKVSNSSLGISNVVAHIVDGTLIYVNGADITNANLTSGVILTSNTSSSTIRVNHLYPVQNTTGNGTISFVNSSIMTVTGDFGYFVPGYSITDGTATATVTSITRNTDWTGFPAVTLANKNLDLDIGSALESYDLEVGTITYLSQINPGTGYLTDPTVTITESAILDLQIPDKTGFKGGNAVVNAEAGAATGVVSSIDIYDSGFGYTTNEYLLLSSSNTQNQTVVTGRSVIDTNGRGVGYFANRSGFLSDTQHVIDSYYWQSLSYDIIAPRMMRTYENFVRDLVHPSGIALFGSLEIASELDNEDSDAVYSHIEAS